MITTKLRTWHACKAYADLAVHLAGSFIQFVINRATACKPKEAVSSFSDKDDVPF